MAEKQVREIVIRVDSDKSDKTLRDVAKGFREVNTSIKETTSVLNSLRTGFAAIAGFQIAGVGIRSVVNLADSMQKLTDRLTLSEGSSSRAIETLDSLGGIANSTKSSIEDVATVYNRLNLSLSDLGVGSTALLGITQELTQTFKLSGATSSEATAAVIQLSQGLASGQLRGQELRSVLEQNALFGEILAKQLGKTRGELLKFAEKEGGIKSADVLLALANNFDSINKRAQQLSPTIKEALTTSFNDMALALNKANKEFGITEKFVGAISFLSKNFEDIAQYVGMMTSAWIAYEGALFLATTTTEGFYTLVSGTKFVGALVKYGTLLAAISGPLAIITGSLVAGKYAVEEYAATMGKSLSNVGEFGASNAQLSTSIRKQVEEYKQTTAQQKLAYESGYELSQSLFRLKEDSQLFRQETSQLGKEFVSLRPGAEGYEEAIRRAAQAAQDANKQTFDFDKSLAALNRKFSNVTSASKAYSAELRKLQIQDLQDKRDNKGTLTKGQYEDAVKNLDTKSRKEILRDFREEIERLNKSFQNTPTGITNYARELDKINIRKLSQDAKAGSQNMLELNQEITKSKLEELNRKVAEGSDTFSLTSFRIASTSLQLEILNQKFREGKIDVFEYNNELIKTSEKFEPNGALFVGTQNYITQAGTLSQNVAGLVTNTFSKLEDSLVAFTKTGKFVFRDFALSVLEDLNRIIIRALVIRPIAQGILGSIPTGAETQQVVGVTTPGPVQPSAMGSYFDGKTSYFAAGGVVTRPTAFKYGSGKNGIMGEAGPEAIIPLKRGANGELGVQGGSGSNVVVNVVNNNGGEVSQSESTNANGDRVIDILIESKVKEGFASGKFDKTMQSQYGIRRKGN